MAGALVSFVLRPYLPPPTRLAATLGQVAFCWPRSSSRQADRIADLRRF